MWNRRLSKPLLWALALSLAAHVLLIARYSGWSLPEGEEGSFVVELAPLPSICPKTPDMVLCMVSSIAFMLVMIEIISGN